MHVQPLFAMTEREELHRLMRDYPLATVVVARSGKMDANLLPLHLSDRGAHGLLSGHVARSHSLWTQDPGETEVTAVFQSPNAYISPRWYVNGQRSGRNAPSWNYVAVHLTGRLLPLPQDALEPLLEAQSAFFEARLPKVPWTMEKMTEETRAKLLRMILPFRFEVERVDSTWKLGQNKPETARRAAAEAVGGGIGQELDALAQLMRVPPASD